VFYVQIGKDFSSFVSVKPSLKLATTWGNIRSEIANPTKKEKQQTEAFLGIL
jgi:hypothetical protein